MANHIANSTRYFLPHIYALTPTRPSGRAKTGYKSYRTKVFDKFPRTGIPEYFESIEAYDNFVKLLVKPIASTTRRRSGGTSAFTPSSIPWNSGSAMCR